MSESFEDSVSASSVSVSSLSASSVSDYSIAKLKHEKIIKTTIEFCSMFDIAVLEIPNTDDAGISILKNIEKMQSKKMAVCMTTKIEPNTIFDCGKLTIVTIADLMISRYFKILCVKQFNDSVVTVAMQK